jgi:Uma2 family endonuclease
MVLAPPEFPSSPHRYLRPPAPLVFPESEEMPESRRHLELRTLLFQILQLAFGDRAVIGSEQFVYWDPTNPGRRCAPDVMARLGEPDAPFASWKVWQRGAPHLAIEVMSPGDLDYGPWQDKLERYRQVGVRELVGFDPENEALPLRIWDGHDGDLVERDTSDPLFHRCDTFDAYWCIRQDPSLGRTLRLARDPEGLYLFPTPAEKERQRADEERQRADEERQRAEARIRELEAELARRDRER